MRYRPFGATGKAVSAISLLLREAPNMHSPAAWRALAFCAMENGVNSFELTAGSDVLAMGVGEALSAVADEALTRRPDGKTHFARVVCEWSTDDSSFHARSAGGQGSHQLSAMAGANALAVLPDGEGIEPGGRVDVMLLT